MRFDFENFFNSNNITCVTEGNNVKRGHVNCKCPWCGNDDPSEHMGCDPSSGMYGCWKSSQHRGKNPAKLIQKLLNCTWAEACRITGTTELTPGVGTIEDLERQSSDLTRKEILGGFRIIKYPPEFRDILPMGLTRAAWSHIHIERGFHRRDIADLCQYYKLKYAITGDFKKRIIIPYLHKGLATIGFQARALGSAALRFITEPGRCKETLLNYGHAEEGGKVLVIVEGAFGFLKVDFYGKREGIRAVGTAGTGYTEKQVAAIFKLASKYKYVVCLFDPGAEAEGLTLCSKLSKFGAVNGELPEGLSGPDECRPEDVIPLIEKIVG
jgi:hypothetical protein